MKEVKTEFKERTIAVDFDGVIHKYSQGFQGLNNAYDVPTLGTRAALEEMKNQGFRLIIVSSRPTPTIREWLRKYEMEHFFDDVSNTKHPAKYYIDDHAIYFNKKENKPWDTVLQIIKGD